MQHGGRLASVRQVRLTAEVPIPVSEWAVASSHAKPLCCPGEGGSTAAMPGWSDPGGERVGVAVLAVFPFHSKRLQ